MYFENPVLSRMEHNTMCFDSDSPVVRALGEVYALFPSVSPCASTARFDPGSEEWLAERTRIAQELHDTLLQGFLGVSMQLHAAVDRMSMDCAETHRLGDVLKLLDRVLEEARSTVQGLRSPIGRNVSLGEALASVPRDLGFSAAQAFRVVVFGQEKTLRAGTFQEVYRIGCEAIINACRHSQATKIETEVEYRPTGLRIAVCDNGCGIGPHDLQWGRAGHWGLRGMRERADRIGARIQARSRADLGTEVELNVPGHIAYEQYPGLGALESVEFRAPA